MEQFFKDYLEILETLHNDFKKAIAGLSVEALDWTPGREMNSLSILVVHTMGAQRYWIGDVALQIPTVPTRVRATEFQAHGLDEAALVQLLDKNLAFAQTELAKCSVQDLAAVRTSPNHPGQPTTFGHSLSHALEHTGLHLGHAQLTRQLWDHNYG